MIANFVLVGLVEKKNSSYLVVLQTGIQFKVFSALLSYIFVEEEQGRMKV
jgi:hypothetical protein